MADPTSNAMKATSNTNAPVRARRSVAAVAAVAPCACTWPDPCSFRDAGPFTAPAPTPPAIPSAAPPPASAIARHMVGMGQHLFDQAPHVGVVDHVVDASPLPPAAYQAG